EEALFQQRIDVVPQRRTEAQALVLVADGGQAILAPAVSAADGLLEGEVRPGVAVGGVVLADGAPLPFAYVRSPAPPGGALFAFLKPLSFGAHLLSNSSFLAPNL